MSEKSPELIVTFPDGHLGTVDDLKNNEIISISGSYCGLKLKSRLAVYLGKGTTFFENGRPSEIEIRFVCQKEPTGILISKISAIRILTLAELFCHFEKLLGKAFSLVREFQGEIVEMKTQ